MFDRTWNSVCVQLIDINYWSEIILTLAYYLLLQICNFLDSAHSFSP